jgi:hypothetical protein
MPALMFYESVIPLDRERHRTLRLKPLPHQSFAAKTGAIPVVVGEFVDVSREYPIVFARDAKGDLSAVALVGSRSDENLFIDADGVWGARYVPAFIRRYPFIFGENGAGQLILCIDEACPAFSQDEGELLFDAGGEPKPVLQKTLALLSEYQQQTALTAGFVRRIQEAGLLQERQMRANMPDGRSAALDGFLVVGEAQLRAATDAMLKTWFDSGELALIYAHLFSLGNFIELARRQPEVGGAPQPQP